MTAATLHRLLALAAAVTAALMAALPAPRAEAGAAEPDAAQTVFRHYL